MTLRDGRVPWRDHVVHWARTAAVRVLGVALVVGAARPWETPHGVVRPVVFAGAAVFALWAAPGLDRRPSLASARWSHRVARHRTSLLACGAVCLAAAGETRAWQGLCVAVLLVMYLVASDAWSLGATARRGVGRVWLEGLGAVLGAGVVVLGASAGRGPGAWGGLGAAVVVLGVGVGVGVGCVVGWWLVRRGSRGRVGGG
ncbi:hypothetical protein [Streptomyces sp. NPDC006552]|uniref:hypothetical protein n=1 Tax=Streptomyces sp. NPDC006552 TaxID=3157179 RepID=UPI0033A34D0A